MTTLTSLTSSTSLACHKMRYNTDKMEQKKNEPTLTLSGPQVDRKLIIIIDQ